MQEAKQRATGKQCLNLGAFKFVNLIVPERISVINVRFIISESERFETREQGLSCLEKRVIKIEVTRLTFLLISVESVT